MLHTHIPLHVHIRWMIRRDLPEILQIEASNFGELVWTEENFLDCLRQRNYIGMVVEHREKVIGFMIYELTPKRLNVLNLAVHPQYRRRGVGAQLIAKLISKLASHQRSRVVINVRETNLPAQLFLKAQAFFASRVNRRFYADPVEDGYRMVYRLLPQIAEEPAHIESSESAT